MWEDVRRCEKMWEDEEKMGGWEDVKMRRCEDEKMWRCEDVKMRRCEDERMWRWEDVKMRGCEDEKMWRWEDVKMRRCEDERMWRWEDVLQTPTIGRTCAQTLSGKNLDCATRWHIPGWPIEAKSTEFSAKGNRFFLTKVYESTKVHGRRLVKMFFVWFDC